MILDLRIAGWAAASTTSALATATISTTSSATTSAIVELWVAVLLALALPVTLLELGLNSLLLLECLHGGLGGSLKVRNRSRNRLGVVIYVEAFVDARRNWLNLSAKVPFNVVEVEAIIPVDQVNRQTQVTVSAGSTDSVQIGFSILGEIKVDNNVDSLDINTTGQEIGANEVSADAVAEVVEDTVTSLLLHPRVTVKAGIAKFCNFLGEKFDSIGRVAENDRLVDLKLGEEGVQAMDLLLLFNKGVVLSDTPECKFVHKVDFIRADHVLVRKVLDGQGEGGGEKHDLSVLGVELKQLFNDGSEFDG